MPVLSLHIASSHLCNVNIKALLQSLNKPWLIEETAAIHYAELLQKILSNEMIPTAGLFGPDDRPYRISDGGVKASDGGVLVIPVLGPIMKDDFCGSLGTESMGALIEEGNADKTIKGFVLKMSTPGGSVMGTEDFASIIGKSKKPIIAHGDMMASAGYWIASQAREIHIPGQTSMVGCIGTMAVLRDTRALHEKNGIKEHVIFASRSSDKNRSSREAMDGKFDAYIKEILDPLNTVFEKTVTSARDGKIDLNKEDVATGKIYTGNTAIKVGLVDKIGSLQTAIKRVYQLANSTNLTSNSKKNTMNLTPFAKVLAAANANEFQVIEGGFLVEEKHLSAINANIVQHEQTAGTQATTIANHSATIADITGKLTASENAKSTAETSLTAANARINALETEINGLKANTPPSSTTKEGEDELPSSSSKSSLPKFYSSLKK